MRNTSLSIHITGVCIALSALVLVSVPFGIYTYQNRYKFYSEDTKILYTRKDYENSLKDASEKLDRGLYKNAYDILKHASDWVMKRDFACEALTAFADLLYKSKNPDERTKYNDALFFYLLAGSRRQNDGKEVWRYFQIANCHKNIGYDTSAITGYKDIINKYPQSPYIEESKVNLAHLLLERRKIDEARDILVGLINNTKSESILSNAIFELSELYMKEAALLPVIKKSDKPPKKTKTAISETDAKK